MRRNRQKEKTPDASGHMAAAPGVCCYLFVLVCEIEFLAVIVRIRHTCQLGKGLLGQRPHIPGMAAVILPIVLRRSALWYICRESGLTVCLRNL